VLKAASDFHTVEVGNRRYNKACTPSWPTTLSTLLDAAVYIVRKSLRVYGFGTSSTP